MFNRIRAASKAEKLSDIIIYLTASVVNSFIRSGHPLQVQDTMDILGRSFALLVSTYRFANLDMRPALYDRVIEVTMMNMERWLKSNCHIVGVGGDRTDEVQEVVVTFPSLEALFIIETGKSLPRTVPDSPQQFIESAIPLYVTAVTELIAAKHARTPNTPSQWSPFDPAVHAIAIAESARHHTAQILEI
ncbi:MAG: hypothetical protein IPH75_10360 [bacterium]|nr:hypothetical protein [bacterium]